MALGFLGGHCHLDGSHQGGKGARLRDMGQTWRVGPEDGGGPGPGDMAPLDAGDGRDQSLSCRRQAAPWLIAECELRQLTPEQHGFELWGPLTRVCFPTDTLEKFLEICNNLKKHFFSS